MSTLLTTRQAADRLGISIARVKQLIDEAILPAEKYGHILMVRSEDLTKARKRPKKKRMATATVVNPALLTEREARLYLGSISKTRLYRLLRDPVAKRVRVKLGAARGELMRVIVIDDKDALALLDRLKLTTFEDYCCRTSEIYDIGADARKAMVEEIHRRFHFVVSSWLREQGANTVR